ncbi:hypothetical protein AAMO2058_000484600 [Amorphochlora amoebiformis]
MVKPIHAMTFTELGLLSVVVAIRTVLSFHLNHDLHAIAEEMEHEQEARLQAEAAQKKVQRAKLVNNLFGSGKKNMIIEISEGKHSNNDNALSPSSAAGILGDRKQTTISPEINLHRGDGKSYREVTDTTAEPPAIVMNKLA